MKLRRRMAKFKVMISNASFIFKMIWKIRKQYFSQSVLLILTDALSPFIAIILPRYIINELTQGKRPDVVLELVALMVVVSILLSTLQAFLKNNTLMNAKFMMVPLSVEFNRKNMEMDFENLEDPEILDEKEKAQSMVLNGECTDKYLMAVNSLISNLLCLIGLSFIISSISIFVLVLIISASVLYTWSNIRIQKKNFDINTKMMPVTRKWNYLQWLGRNESFGKTIRIYKLADWLINKIKENRKEYVVFRDETINNNRFKEIIGTLIGVSQQLLIYLFLIFKVVSRKMLVGDFVMYTNSISSYASVFSAFVGNYIDVKNYGKYISQYRNFLERPNTMRMSGKKENIGSGPHTIEFQHVFFKYPRSENYILKDICLTLEPGEKLSIVGDNGAGKTTFIKILMRLYDVTEGAVLLDNRNIKDYDYQEYMSIIATVFQDYKIFAFSVLENVALSSSDNIDENELEKALESGGIAEKIKNLSKGSQTHLSRQYETDGVTLSGGEQQKLVLCRAIFKNASLIILDEPTSSFSPMAEHDIYERFNQLVKDKSAIFVSHRLTSSQFCDKVALFDQGKIIEYGSHSELMALDGKYAEMFRLQASYYMEVSK